MHPALGERHLSRPEEAASVLRESGLAGELAPASRESRHHVRALELLDSPVQASMAVQAHERPEARTEQPEAQAERGLLAAPWDEARVSMAARTLLLPTMEDAAAEPNAPARQREHLPLFSLAVSP